MKNLHNISSWQLKSFSTTMGGSCEAFVYISNIDRKQPRKYKHY